MADWTEKRCREYVERLHEEMEGEIVMDVFKRALDEVPERNHGTVLLMMLASGQCPPYTP